MKVVKEINVTITIKISKVRPLREGGLLRY